MERRDYAAVAVKAPCVSMGSSPFGLKAEAQCVAMTRDFESPAIANYISRIPAFVPPGLRRGVHMRGSNENGDDIPQVPAFAKLPTRQSRYGDGAASAGRAHLGL